MTFIHFFPFLNQIYLTGLARLYRPSTREFPLMQFDSKDSNKSLILIFNMFYLQHSTRAVLSPICLTKSQNQSSPLSRRGCPTSTILSGKPETAKKKVQIMFLTSEVSNWLLFGQLYKFLYFVKRLEGRAGFVNIL